MSNDRKAINGSDRAAPFHGARVVGPVPLPTRIVTTVEFATIAYLKIQRMTLNLAR